MNDIIEIQEIQNEEHFKKVLNSSTPILIDFWAEWCNPCKVIAPLLERIQGQYKSRLKIFKVNIDHHPLIATNYSVRAIPTLILFKQGTEAERVLGSKSDNELISFLEPHLSNLEVSK